MRGRLPICHRGEHLRGQGVRHGQVRHGQMCPPFAHPRLPTCGVDDHASLTVNGKPPSRQGPVNEQHQHVPSLDGHAKHSPPHLARRRQPILPGRSSQRHASFNQFLDCSGVQRRRREFDDPHLGGVAQSLHHLIGDRLASFPTSLDDEFHREKLQHSPIDVFLFGRP